MHSSMYMKVIQQHAKQSNTLSIHMHVEFMSQITGGRKHGHQISKVSIQNL